MAANSTMAAHTDEVPKELLKTLLSYDDADEKSILRLYCFKKDRGNDTADCLTATHANRGLVERSRYFEGGNRMTLMHQSIPSTNIPLPGAPPRVLHSTAALWLGFILDDLPQGQGFAYS